MGIQALFVAPKNEPCSATCKTTNHLNPFLYSLDALECRINNEVIGAIKDENNLKN